MKIEEIKIRITPTLKKDFQDICEIEETTMSNKINEYIVKEVIAKKSKPYNNQVLTRKLIKLDIINKNHRLYSKSEFTTIKLNEDGLEYTELDRLNEKIFYGQFRHPDHGDVIHKYNATHSISNFKIIEDWLEGDITILNSSLLPILNNLIFAPRSFGEVNDRSVVINLEIIGFDALPKSESSFD